MRNLRIAIILESEQVYAWQKAIVSELNNSNYATIVLNLNHSNETIIEHHQSERSSLLWKLYVKIDRFLFMKPDHALTKCNLEDLKHKSPTLVISKDLNLKEFNLDVIINLSEIVPDKDIINASKHGLWYLNQCDLKTINKRPYGIWEMLTKQPETIAVLRSLKNSISSAFTIDRTSSCTDNLSFSRNLNDIFWQANSLIYNNLKLLAKDESLFDKKVKSKSTLFADAENIVPFISPSNLRTLTFSGSIFFKKIIQIFKSRFYFEQWILIFHNNKNNSNPYKLSNYKEIRPPKDRFWADPFLIHHNDKCYLFIEELIYKNKLGHLSVMEIDEYGNYTNPQKILVKDYHLSYPFVFEDNGEFFMIPETSNNSDIQLYRCIEFPLKWKLEKVIMSNVVAVDTTIYKEDDTYWLFTSLKQHYGQSKHVELYLFSSNNLITDQWKPHPLNPIISDVKTARPAGALFKLDNKLYRPSQNCSIRYGYGLNILEINEINESSYREKIVHAIQPNWKNDIKCTHTFNASKKFFISDVKLKRRRFFS